MTSQNGMMGNSEALRRFASRLAQFSRETKDSQRRLQTMFRGLHWADPVQRSFEQEFNEANKILDRFVHQIEEEHIPYLNKKADQIDDYSRGVI